MKSQDELPWTGERLVTSIFNFGAIDHLHRYAIAIELVKGKDVLDIASGEGYGSYIISGHAKEVVGVDISREAVEHATKKYQKQNLQFKMGSADHIPLPDNSVDMVVSFETIEHHDKHDEMLTEIKRVLRPGGLLLISSPDKLNYSEIPGIINEYHVKELYGEEFKSLMKNHFENTVFLNQKYIKGSLIVPENGPSEYCEFSGDYNATSTFKQIQHPVYNLCLASQGQIPKVSVSVFCAKDGAEIQESPAVESNNSVPKQHKLRQCVRLFVPPIVVRLFRRQ
jgi:ubiquinone/menaquinone biosynthesis C-methylase UbiE